MTAFSVDFSPKSSRHMETTSCFFVKEITEGDLPEIHFKKAQ